MTKRVILLLAASVLLLAIPEPTRADPIVASGYTVSELDLGGGALGGIAFSNGGTYGTNLYVGASGAIYQVAPGLSSSSIFATTGVGTGPSRPDGLAFAPASFGTGGQLYASSDNGSVSKISPSGTVSVFSSGGTLDSSNDLVFANSAPYGNFLYVSNGPFYYGDISQVGPTGTNSVFSPITAFPSTVPIGLAFAPAGSSFVSALYTGLGDGKIDRVDSAGLVTLFTTVPGVLDGMAFSSPLKNPISPALNFEL